jgi:NAD(P)H dehydrogenase (quinone)
LKPHCCRIPDSSDAKLVLRDLAEVEFAAALLAVGLPEAFASGLASWEVGASAGALFDDGGQLSRLIGRPTTPLPSAVEEALRQLSGGSTS